MGLGLCSGSGTTVFRGSVCCFFLTAVRGFKGPPIGSRSEYLVGLLPYRSYIIALKRIAPKIPNYFGAHIIESLKLL